MKNYLFILAVFLVSVFPATAQDNRTFYRVCRSVSEFKNVELNNDQVTMKSFTNDSITFETLSYNLNSTSEYSAKKDPNYDFLLEAGTSNPDFYVYKVGDNSFFIISIKIDAYAYFHTDKKKLYEKDSSIRCAKNDLAQFDTILKTKKEKDTENEKADATAEKIQKQKFESETKGVVTDFIKNYQSQVKDPVIEKGIQLWWRGGDANAVIINPLLRIYHMQSVYEYPRNDLGVVLRKTKDAIILYKKKSENKCYIQWRSYGFESLGGGAFSDDMNSWVKTYLSGFNYYPSYLVLPGERKIYSGTEYEVDCAPFQSLTPKTK